jgi:hypothetical protein
VIVVGRILVLPMVLGVVAIVLVVDEAAGDVILGIVGSAEVPRVELPRVLGVGNTPIVGTAGAELTPRLPISVDPIGIPVRAPPPSVVGEVDVGVDDETVPAEPEPHIPDIPEVSSTPNVVDSPEVADIPDDADIAADVDIPDVAAVAGLALPVPIPPPSKAALDPNIPDGEVPMVEHVALLPGMEIVPVVPVGAGLRPGDAISVEPRGMPVGETVEPVPSPSGEVAPMVGVGLAIPVTCAMAVLPTKSAGTTTAMNENLIGILLLPTTWLRRAPMVDQVRDDPAWCEVIDIGQSHSGGA